MMNYAYEDIEAKKHVVVILLFVCFCQQFPASYFPSHFSPMKLYRSYRSKAEATKRNYVDTFVRIHKQTK